MSDGQYDIVDALEYTAAALDIINRRSDAKMVRAGKDIIKSLRAELTTSKETARVLADEAKAGFSSLAEIASMETMRNTQEDRMKRIAQAAIANRASTARQATNTNPSAKAMVQE